MQLLALLSSKKILLQLLKLLVVRCLVSTLMFKPFRKIKALRRFPRSR